MEASLQSPHCSKTATPTFERRLYIDHIKDSLTPLDKSHGALQESVVVWGVTGIGKRSIALKAAQEICETDGRQLLVLNGRTCGTLIASFAKAYIAFTGRPLSRHEHFVGNFYQFRLHLNRRRREWIMVVLDICADTEPPAFLPDRGQIIFTNTVYSHEKNPHRLLSAVAPTFLYVPPLSQKEVRLYSRAQFPELLHMPRRGNGLLERYHTTLLDLKLIAANMRLLNCSYQAYYSYYSCRIRDRATATMYLLPLAFLPKVIHREIFWDLLVEHDRWAGRLLAALTFMDPWSVPVAALCQLPLFKNTIAERLQPALELLYSLQVITVENEHVSVQPALHTWLRGYLPNKCLKADWNALRLAWTIILRDSMSRESANVFDQWSLGVHAWALSNFLSVKRDPPRLESLMFLTSAAKLPIFYVIYRDTLLEDALKLCGSLSSRTPDFTGETYDYYVTKVRLARADDYLPDDVRKADAELRLAMPYVRYIESPHLYWKMKELQWQIEVRVLLTQEKYAEAETFLDYLFDRYPLTISIRTRKRLYHLMAVVLTERDKTVAALQYSHDAMNFFAHRYKPDGRPPRVRLAAEVVDAHVDLLLKMKKYRGALLYLVPTIEKMLITLPHRPPVILKYARQALHCYTALRNLADGERLVLQILEANTDPDCGIREDRSYPFINGLSNDCLLEYISMLVLLASLYLWHGRIIEAEGVMRYIIAIGLQREPDGMTRFVNCFKDLMLFLYARGHHTMLKHIEDDLVALHGRTYPSEEIDKILHGYSKTKETYQRALWAAEDGFYGKWWADFLTEGPMRSGFILAELLWGKVEDRARDRPDFTSDIDEGGIARAKKSKVLHLLGFDVVGLAFATNLFPQKRTTMKNDQNEEVEFYRGLAPHSEKFPSDEDEVANIDIDSIPSRSQAPSPGAAYSDRSGRNGASANHQASDAQGPNDASSGNIDVAEQESDEIQPHSSPLPRRESMGARMSREGDTAAARPASPYEHAPPAPRAPTRRRRRALIERTFPGRIRAPITEPRRSGKRDSEFSLNVIDLWFNYSSQRTLPEYWSWCDCRRHRTRSKSLDRVDLISKRFIREECEKAALTDGALVQKRITDSYILLPPEPKARPTACRSDCPCIAANAQGAIDWAEHNLDIVIWPSDSPYVARSPVSSRKWNTVSSGRHPLFCPSSPNRYKRSLRPTPSLLPDTNFICLTRILASMEADPAAWNAAVAQSQDQDNHEPLAEALWVDEATQQVPLGSSWKFVQSELTPMMERPGENYCLKHALELPDIVVKLAEDEWCLHGVDGKARWGWREVKEKAELQEVRAAVEFWRAVEGDDVGKDGGEWPWEGVKMVEFAEDPRGDGKRRKAWVKWRQRNVYNGDEEKWWVLTKSKELLTEFFERGAFGPSQRVRAERELKEWMCPQEGLVEIPEDECEAEQDSQDSLTVAFADFRQEEADSARAEAEIVQAEAGNHAEGQGGEVEEVAGIQQLPQGDVDDVDDDNDTHDDEHEEDQAARDAFYRECWASVAENSTTERS